MLPETMHVVQVKAPGGPEVLEYVTLPISHLKEGWSLVRVYGFGINHSEIFTREGLSPTVQFPRVLGIECVGRVVQSSDPARLPVGSRVCSLMGEMGRAFDGGYAEYVLLPNSQIYRIDTSLSWEETAAVPETFYTAYLSHKNLKVEEGMKVLVRGATSGVGVAFLRLLQAGYKNVRVYGTTRSARKTALLTEVGFDEVVIDADGALETQETFDRALELIGPATMKDTCAHVAEGGIVCSTGQLGGQWYLDGFDPIFDLPPNGYLTSAYSGNVSERVVQELFKYVEEKQVNVAPERVFSLEEVPQAHAYLQGSHSFGKVVVLTPAGLMAQGGV
jgi:NADPH:quinone reductase-like Zn-dependent oxidoreductase